MWMSAATLGGSGGKELWINTSSCDHTRAVVSIRDPSRLVVTCMVGGHTLDFCVLRAPSAHPPQRAEEWWVKTGSVLRTVFRPTRDTALLGSASRSDFDDNGYFLLNFMHDWDMETPASFEPLPLLTWTSRGGKEHEIDFVLVISAWHHLVQWSAVIPRVSLALRGQDDHRLADRPSA